MPSRVERGLSVLLKLLLALFIALSIHNFFSYIDHYPYWSIDDGLSVLSTSLVDVGRYGDPAVPVEPLNAAQRYRGFFDYGPWYFFAGAGFVWLFGFSVKLLRSLHLLAELSLIVAAGSLFRGLRGVIATTMIGVWVGYAVNHLDWPMVRPDPFVTLFAGASLWAAARAALSGRSRYWFTCGLAAGCAMFSHMIAVTLVPAVTVVCALTVAYRQRLTAGAGIQIGPLIRSLATLVAGWAVSLLMFSAATGFRLGVFVRQILAYRSTVRATTEASLNSVSPIAVWREHYRIAASGMDNIQILLVAVALLAALFLVVRALAHRTDANLEVIAFVLPGLTVFTFYVAGLGFYQNFHTGYVILPRLIGAWLAASTVYVGLGKARLRMPSMARAAEITAAVVLAIGTANMVSAAAASAHDPRMALARSWIGSSNYLGEVLGPVPEAAVAWGPVTFAAEGPQRIQLVSLETAERVMGRVPVDRRSSLAPDYLIWGHPQNRDAVMFPVSAPEKDPVALLRALLPDARFSLMSLVAGAPYGVTRVLARQLPGPAINGMPLVSAWDADLQRWMHRVVPMSAVAWSPARGTLQVSKGRQMWTWNATDSAAADLPPDWYLVRVNGADAPRSRHMLTIGSDTRHDFAVGDLPPPIDVAVGLAPEPVYLLLHHSGGRIGVNLYSAEPGARLGTIETFSVRGFDDYRVERERQLEQPLPELSQWVPDGQGGVTATRTGTALVVAGNSSASGYQLVSPPLPVRTGTEATIRLPIAVDAGDVCTGVLDEQRRSWVVPPADRAEVHRFVTGGNAAVFVVVANCRAAAATAVASRFTVTRGTYAVAGERWYTDALMRFWR